MRGLCAEPYAALRQQLNHSNVSLAAFGDGRNKPVVVSTKFLLQTCTFLGT